MTDQFCWCGRVHVKGLCPRHKGKPKPEKRSKGVPFSGDSKYREKMGQFQAKEGR